MHQKGAETAGFQNIPDVNVSAGHTWARKWRSRTKILRRCPSVRETKYTGRQQGHTLVTTLRPATRTYKAGNKRERKKEREREREREKFMDNQIDD